MKSLISLSKERDKEGVAMPPRCPMVTRRRKAAKKGGRAERQAQPLCSTSICASARGGKEKKKRSAKKEEGGGGKRGVMGQVFLFYDIPSNAIGKEGSLGDTGARPLCAEKKRKAARRKREGGVFGSAHFRLSRPMERKTSGEKREKSSRGQLLRALSFSIIPSHVWSVEGGKGGLRIGGSEKITIITTPPKRKK